MNTEEIPGSPPKIIMLYNMRNRVTYIGEKIKGGLGEGIRDYIFFETITPPKGKSSKKFLDDIIKDYIAAAEKGILETEPEYLHRSNISSEKIISEKRLNELTDKVIH